MIGTTRLTGPAGEELILLFDHAARLAAEDVADLAFGDVVERALKGRLRQVGECLYAGLRRHHADLTLAQAHEIVGSAVDTGALIALQTTLLKAVTASMPKAGARGDANPQPAPSGTGTRSSAPGARKGSSRTPSGGKPRAASRKR